MTKFPINSETNITVNSGRLVCRRNKMNRSKILFPSILLCAVLTIAFGTTDNKKRTIALAGGTLIDGTGTTPIKNVVILIQEDKIKAVGPAKTIAVPKNVKKIDVSGRWILPGFIELHIHLTEPYTGIETTTDTDSVSTLRGLLKMNTCLESGITSVRDVGSAVDPMQALLSAGRIGFKTIRLFPCGQMIGRTGGHADDGWKGKRRADGPSEFRKAVRDMYNAGFRIVKLGPPYSMEELEAVADEARKLGMRTTTHGGGHTDTYPTTMNRLAVQAGIQCIEHVNQMEDDVLDMMAQKGVHLVPTLAVYREFYRRGTINTMLVEKRGWTLSMHETLFQKARQRKITMGIGTDANIELGKLYPQIYFTEMKYFVELGCTKMESIVAATRNGAIILGMEDQLGTIEVGKLADLQVISGDPLESLDVLGHPEIVMIGGKIHTFRTNGKNI
jgi:imidazolonepropionase-like amidohydrolase